MSIKTGFVTLGVIGFSALFVSPSVYAESQTPNKTSSKSTKKDDDKSKKDVYVTVKSGDTLEEIAKDKDTTYVRIFNANKSLANPDVINVGEKLRIPTKDEKLPNRFEKLKTAAPAPAATITAPVSPTPTAAAPQRQYTSAPVNANSYYVGNGMWCTDYVASKRSDISVYGNAGYNWISAARSDGKATGSSPRAGAVAVTNGHVAYVENVNADGSYTVSEMGWNYKAGQYNKRTVQPGAFGQFIYK